MIRRHDMPFGATLKAEGACFRLWAPDVDKLEIALSWAGGEKRCPMEGAGDGWWRYFASGLGRGVRYQFLLPDGGTVPDPASRYQPDDAEGSSLVIDPASYDWQDGCWRGRPWCETVIYELHVGTFTPEGTFRAAMERLDDLADLGITAVELMPLADFPGRRNWGYDGVLPFAPDTAYGRPEDLKALVDAAHGRGLMVFLDVVYNHFGPEGNALHRYAEDFFTPRHHTPWGPAINFDGPNSRVVRDFFRHNALYWLEEYHFDGLRFDAVHTICDDSHPDILEEIATAVAAGPGQDRQIHLMLENDHNAAHYLGSGGYRAQWNDDFHHSLHALLTGEKDGYYGDFAGQPIDYLGRCLAEGFAWQGQPSVYRGDRARGEASAYLPPTAFINFLQNHDQIGNRALGERLSRLCTTEALRAAVAVLLLAPAVPLLFMGEEFAASSPFLFFCDFSGELGEAVREGRRREFSAFAHFSTDEAAAQIPDPGAESTFTASTLDWTQRNLGPHADWLQYYRRLLHIRRDEIVPRLGGVSGDSGTWHLLGTTGLAVHWHLADGAILSLYGQWAPEPLVLDPIPRDRIVFAQPPEAAALLAENRLPGWGVVCLLHEGVGERHP
ncbi:MAG TPA: malto-oligosyltrehalose trehalohydrolase [Acidiferrobacter sp.]|nr:malto-oligosyltrehalose trehalohydrolase [Acidiferrobacter sp.]